MALTTTTYKVGRGSAARGNSTVTVLSNERGSVTVQRGWDFWGRECWTVEWTNLLGTCHAAATRRECITVAARMLGEEVA